MQMTEQAFFTPFMRRNVYDNYTRISQEEQYPAAFCNSGMTDLSKIQTVNFTRALSRAIIMHKKNEGDQFSNETFRTLCLYLLLLYRL